MSKIWRKKKLSDKNAPEWYSCFLPVFFCFCGLWPVSCFDADVLCAPAPLPRPRPTPMPRLCYTGVPYYTILNANIRRLLSWRIRSFIDRWVDGRMDGWIDGWMGRWMDGSVDEWMDGWMDGPDPPSVCAADAQNLLHVHHLPLGRDL